MSEQNTADVFKRTATRALAAVVWIALVVGCVTTIFDALTGAADQTEQGSSLKGAIAITESGESVDSSRLLTGQVEPDVMAAYYSSRRLQTCNEDGVTIGDGICNSDANIEGCGFDGGDCCPTTCLGDCSTDACAQTLPVAQGGCEGGDPGVAPTVLSDNSGFDADLTGWSSFPTYGLEVAGRVGGYYNCFEGSMKLGTVVYSYVDLGEHEFVEQIKGGLSEAVTASSNVRVSAAAYVQGTSHTIKVTGRVIYASGGMSEATLTYVGTETPAWSGQDVQIPISSSQTITDVQIVVDGFCPSMNTADCAIAVLDDVAILKFPE